ncbi:hypothetical protein AAKU64_004584 [Undibacterium sp. GrIS 1.8]|uniref:DUF2889 domain-containing protein n=1 Tax=Undibacterium sp. GrIS 1.8 TaxID=3143934 RepID=UPI003398B4C1
MPLPISTSRRALKHTRSIQIDAFARDDGLWDLDAHITDTKTRDIQLASGIRPVGLPLHDLSLRITIDTNLNIVDAMAVSDAVPYPGFCNTISPDYKKLIGLNLMMQFRQGVKERMSGINGCTHITELAQILPTAAVQAFAGDVIDTRDGASSSDISSENQQQPFQLNRCHALRLDGPAVVQYYPRWAVTSSLPPDAKSSA